MSAGSFPDYQVVLDTFQGPLDLLLYLVKRDEVDVLDIPIARIAEQFKHYLDVLTLIDVERAGDFLVLAATLMEIKSKMLLPRPEELAAEEAEDPRRELVKQLLQYKRFKEAAGHLEDLAERQAQRLPRVPVPGPPRKDGPPALQPVELWDLVSAFGRLVRETMAQQPQAIVVDHTPLHVHMENVLTHLERAGRAPFSSLFTPPCTRSRLVGLFLAILELTKMRRLIPEQPAPFAEIWVCLAPPQEESSEGSEAVAA
ncbi:MAG: segregation/condensation protein A [Gemmataceae bacterium]